MITGDQFELCVAQAREKERAFEDIFGARKFIDAEQLFEAETPIFWHSVRQSGKEIFAPMFWS